LKIFGNVNLYARIFFAAKIKYEENKSLQQIYCLPSTRLQKVIITCVVTKTGASLLARFHIIEDDIFLQNQRRWRFTIILVNILLIVGDKYGIGLAIPLVGFGDQR